MKRESGDLPERGSNWLRLAQSRYARRVQKGRSMHIEPGVVDGAKMILGYATGIGSLGLLAKMAWDDRRHMGGDSNLILKSGISTALVFAFFQILPHFPVGVSEVHLILGTTLLLMFGVGPAAIGLTLGLLAQGLFFAPTDLPQLGINLTTLLVPLAAIAMLARSIIPAGTAYVDISYTQALKLSAAYQGGIIAWVAFWAFYGNGFGAENLSSVASFAGAYALVIVIEPLIDLAVLGLAKSIAHTPLASVFTRRLFKAA